MPGSIIDPAATLEIARSAMKRAQEAYELSARNSARIDELEHSSARTVESMKTIFATAVRENSKEQAAAIGKLGEESKAQSASIDKLIDQLSKQEEARTKELKTNRALFVVLAFVLTVFVEYCRRT